MMKKIAFTLMLLCTVAQGFARVGLNSCPTGYVGFSTGLENPGGIIAFTFDFPLAEQFSLGAGVGIGTWGYKTYGEGRFYFGECNSSWAIGSGVSYATGLKNFTPALETTTGTRDVLVDLKPVTNVFVSAYKFWTLGRRGNRIYIQLGYSIRMTSNIYTNKSVYTLTPASTNAIDILAPGGVIIGGGFNFGLGR